MKGEDEDNDNMQIDSGVYLISSVTKMNEIRLMMQQAEEQVQKLFSLPFISIFDLHSKLHSLVQVDVVIVFWGISISGIVVQN